MKKLQSAVLLRKLRRCNTLDAINKDTSFLHPPPDGGWGWVVVLAAFIHSLFVSGFHNAFGVYMLPLLETFKSTSSIIAWIGSISYAFIMIFGPVAGKLLVKHGAIKVCIIGAIVVMFGLVCSSYTHDLRMLFLTQGIIVGVGSSLASTPGLIMVSLYFTTKRSFATGIVMAGGAAGTFVQNKLHEYLIDTLGWRVSLRVYSGILTICIVAGFAYKPLQKHRAHPSVVEKFKTSPLRGFIVDLSLWKDRIFEVWVLALGLAKFGFFIPFVHMIKLAGDLGIPLHQASYIMVGIGVSSMFSCLLFGKICDMEKIDRLYLNQASILSAGVVYFLIPHCTNFASLVTICSLLGFVDAGNYVLLPVLTFDLMGEEKMPVAWGFMMTVNAISCFGPPFAGAMYDIFGNYNIGFVVNGVCNVAAASILAFIPWLKNEAIQSTKNYLNASVCEMTRTIVPWQSHSPSLGSITSSYTRSIMYPPEDATSQTSKRFSMKSFKGILKSETTTSDRGITPKKAEEASVPVPQVFHPEARQQKESATDVRLEPVPVLAEKAASLQSQILEYPPREKEDRLTLLDSRAGSEEKQPEGTTEVRQLQEPAIEEAVSPKEEILDALLQAERLLHRKEDGVAFLDEYVGEEEESLETTVDLRPMQELVLSDGVFPKTEMLEPPKPSERRVSFLDEYDSDDEEEQFDGQKGEASTLERRFLIPHRKEDGVAFLDDYIGDDDDDDDHFENVDDFQSEVPFQSETSRHKEKSGKMSSISHKKADEVAFLDEDDDDNDIFESATDLFIPQQAPFGSKASEHGKHSKEMPFISQKKADGMAFLKDVDGCDTSQQRQLECTSTLKSAEETGKILKENEMSTSENQARRFPTKKDTSTEFGSDEDENEQSQQQK
nr:uncharacterized protein LOC132761127 isoform X1 [Anolis sagrei ordinatus]